MKHEMTETTAEIIDTGISENPDPVAPLAIAKLDSPVRLCRRVDCSVRNLIISMSLTRTVARYQT